MPRRSHKKSRQGCQQCKRRHLKCDETKPSCVNCVTAHLQCPYETEQHLVSDYAPRVENTASRAASQTTSRTASQDGTNSTPTISLSSPTPSLLSSNTPNEPLSLQPQHLAHSSSSSLNMLHLELLHNWLFGLYKTFVPVGAGAMNEIYRDTCMNYGLRFPFLMRQLLATSALHLSIMRPDQNSFYHEHATQLQSEALAEYSAVLANVNQTNIVPAFLVSTLIGLQVFCDTFTSRKNDFNSLLDALAGTINLVRGVRLVIGPWWKFLLSTELKPLLEISERKREQAKDQINPLHDLDRLVASADIGPSSRKAYTSAIRELELVLATEALEEPDVEFSQSLNMLFAWLVVVPPDFVELVHARRAEALVILAHYAVTLHRKRDVWCVGDAGKVLVESISAHLGTHWGDWLAWPLSVVTA